MSTYRDENQPHSVAPAAPGTAPHPKRSFGVGVLAAVAVIALVLGAGAGLVFGGGGDEVSADGDLSTACRYLEDLDLPIEDEDLVVDDPALWRIMAAGNLATAAGGQDSALGEAGQTVLRGIQTRNGEQLNAAVEDVLAHC